MSDAQPANFPAASFLTVDVLSTAHSYARYPARMLAQTERNMP